jgi:hypothetical protein
MAAKRPTKQERLREFWAEVEREADISIERDLLAQLGPQIVIHNFPRHPLNIPVARTVVAEITGSAIAVRTVVDRLLRRFARDLAGSESGWASLQCHQAPDGVWYLQAGVYGPAVAVTDQWLVISFSPAAVRQNVTFLELTSGKVTTGPTKR